MCMPKTSLKDKQAGVGHWIQKGIGLKETVFLLKYHEAKPFYVLPIHNIKSFLKVKVKAITLHTHTPKHSSACTEPQWKGLLLHSTPLQGVTNTSLTWRTLSWRKDKQWDCWCHWSLSVVTVHRTEPNSRSSVGQLADTKLAFMGLHTGRPTECGGVGGTGLRHSEGRLVSTGMKCLAKAVKAKYD